LVKVLLLAPDGWGDVATDISAPYYRVWIKKQIESMGYETIVLEGPQDKKANYDLAIPQSNIITGVGHGNSNVFTGYYMDVLERTPVQQNKYSDKCFCPISCLVGLGLLPDMANTSKNFAGLGEVTEYWLTARYIYMHKGEIGEDDLVESYILSEWAFLQTLLQGKTAEEAYKIMLDTYEQYAERFDKIDPETSYYLRYDAKNRQFFGKPDWQIQPQQPPQPPPPQPKYTCPYCGQEFDKLEDLGEHIKQVHKDVICGQQPPPPPPEKHFICPWCGQEFKTESELVVHMCTVHLKPCKLRYTVRRWLNCPVSKLCSA
jgi:predicted RNA-binding Zn-ribbon protein involved in translation (DUF1610 family)